MQAPLSLSHCRGSLWVNPRCQSLPRWIASWPLPQCFSLVTDHSGTLSHGGDHMLTIFKSPTLLNNESRAPTGCGEGMWMAKYTLPRDGRSKQKIFHYILNGQLGSVSKQTMEATRSTEVFRISDTLAEVAGGRSDLMCTVQSHRDEWLLNTTPTFSPTSETPFSERYR